MTLIMIIAHKLAVMPQGIKAFMVICAGAAKGLDFGTPNYYYYYYYYYIYCCCCCHCYHYYHHHCHDHQADLR